MTWRTATRQTLEEVAGALYFAADRIADLAESPDVENGPGDAASQHVEDGGKWMRGARRELVELIREVEGPKPSPAPRRPKP